MTLETVTERQLGTETVWAMRAVEEAVDLVREVEQTAAGGALSKRDASPVTIADFGVQGFIAARLARNRPSDSLVAEEDASALRTNPALTARVVDFVRQAILQWIPISC